MKLSDVITPGDKIDIKMLHEANVISAAINSTGQNSSCGYNRCLI